MTRSRLARGATLVALSLLAACASGGTRTGGTPDPAMRLQVQNDLVPPRGVTVRAVSAGGPRSMLGTVSAGRTTVLEYEQPGFQGMYYFIAEVDGGPDIQSRSVILREGAELVWSLQTNTLRED